MLIDFQSVLVAVAQKKIEETLSRIAKMLQLVPEVENSAMIVISQCQLSINGPQDSCSYQAGMNNK